MKIEMPPNLIMANEVDFADKEIKKVLIVSDSHSIHKNLFKVIKKLDNYMDLMIHLGDFECQPEVIATRTEVPFIAVKGNCDYDSRLPKMTKLKIKGHDILITHGSSFLGEYSIADMIMTALENKVEVLMVGHTHVPYYYKDEETGVTIVNPGSISRPRQYDGMATYLVMNVKNDGTMEFVPVSLRRRGKN
jgi:putative phosphoesterase